MLGKSHIPLAAQQSKQVTDNDSLSTMAEVAKRRCGREHHSNRAQNPYMERGSPVNGCVHLRSNLHQKIEFQITVANRRSHSLSGFRVKIRILQHLSDLRVASI